MGLDAVWDDDVHHALHTLLTGETAGYYADFGGPGALATVLMRAYFHAGTYSSFRGRVHGRPVDRYGTPGHRFVASLQNHDQIGNRAVGDRLSATLAPGLLRVGAALLLTSPFTPMLFMGEEWGAGTPWQFFTSHPEPELGTATANGRKAEFAQHGWNAAEVPDPQDPDTFSRSKLDWSELGKPEHGGLLEFYRRLIALRRATPDLTDPRLDQVEALSGPGTPDVAGRADTWIVVRRGGYLVAANVGTEADTVPAPGLSATSATVLTSADGVALNEGTVTLPAASVAIIRL
jgi:maltooligosyltrehalose trehalohydrolase